MKIVVVGGTGLIGQKLIPLLQEQGHTTVSASPRSGVNAVTGEGLAECLAGADIVVDVSNSPSFADEEVRNFFDRSTRNLLAAEQQAGVKHHIALSVVGADGMPESGYMRAKVLQEKLIEAGGIPYTIVRATQFYEFVGTILGANTRDDGIRLPSAMFQPVAAMDVAKSLAEVVGTPPRQGIANLAGPDAMPMDQFARRYLTLMKSPQVVITDPAATYFGMPLAERSLVPDRAEWLGELALEEWGAGQ